jgi:hypothetical protein
MPKSKPVKKLTQQVKDEPFRTLKARGKLTKVETHQMITDDDNDDNYDDELEHDHNSPFDRKNKPGTSKLSEVFFDEEEREEEDNRRFLFESNTSFDGKGINQEEKVDDADEGQDDENNDVFLEGDLFSAVGVSDSEVMF